MGEKEILGLESAGAEFEEVDEDEFLGGRVRRRRLPVYEGPPGPDAPILKRICLPQGELAQIYGMERGMRYIALIEMVAGKDRGNHYHHRKEEWIYLLEGEVELQVEDPETREGGRLALRKGDLVVIMPGVAHVVRPGCPGQAIEFSPQEFDPGDSEPYPLD